jgi:hypothetical protein
VLAFAVAAIRRAPADIRLFLETKTLVVDSMAAGRQLLPGAGLVLFLRNDAAKSPGQFSSLGTLLIPLGRQQRGAGTPVLVRPTAFAMGVAMRSMGLEENRALTLARGCGRSLAALARLIPSGSYDPPGWLQKGQELLPAILAGAWDTSNTRDQEIVQQIAGGATCSQVEGGVRTFLRDADPPFDLEGTVWKVRAPMDAFMRVGHLIGPQESELLRRAMLTVFGEIEPEVEPDEVVDFSRPRPTTYSEWLREGLATTFLLFAVWGDIAEVNLGGESGQEFANRLLNDLPGLRTNPRLLTSLRNELPLLAEAAPDPLLSALEHLLEGSGETILPIFRERSGFFHPTSQHTGVLWALETLAWDPAYFRRAVMILAHLAAIDPGGTLGNRPDRSLTEIFLLWNPNTNASSAQRLAALDEIAQSFPSVGWKLALSLLPTIHGVSTPTAKPKLREAGATDRPAVTYGELWTNQAAVAERAITLATRDLGRWMELVRRLTSFAPQERARAVMALDRTLATLNEEERKVLWIKLREEISRHERFRSAGWALPEEELAPLRIVAEKYTPADPIVKIASLFNNWALDGTIDIEKDNQKRAAVLRQLFTEGGAEAVLRLASEAKVPYLIVEAAFGAEFSTQQVAELLALSFEHDPSSDFSRSLFGLYRNVAGAEEAEAWLRRTVNEKKLAPEITGRLFEVWPDGRETWNAVRHFESEVASAYWKHRPPRYLKGSRLELLRSLLMFLRYGRAIEAIQSSVNRLAEVPSKLILRMLDDVITQINIKGVKPDTMTNFYVEKALEALDRRTDIEEHEIASREYRFFPLLEHGDRTLRINEVMAKDPMFFHFVLKNVFRGENEEAREIDAREEANARISYSLLSQFHRLPGLGPNGIDSAALATWIDEVRRLGVSTGRAEITDSYVGRMLAHAPADADGVWPATAIRTEIERLASDKIDRGIQFERFNMRGAHYRGVYQGGDEERALAKTNFDAATAAAAWRRTAALLRAIGKMWDEEAKRADIEAAQRRLRS